jgi:carbonic anhydrase
VISAAEALERLKEGNRHFVAGIGTGKKPFARSRPLRYAKEQKPFAIVLGCSDSRVPAEIVFDQGLGELFVIRVAGNIVAPSQVGSVEFAAQRFGTPLVVVLGHTRCGAIEATIEELEQPDASNSRNVRFIVEHIRPSVEGLLRTGAPHTHDELVDLAVRANVAASVDKLRHGSDVLWQLVQEGKLLVVGAEYSLETGVVEFFEERAAGAA